MKNIPQRTCIVCRKQKNKNELLRIVKNNENFIKVDPNSKTQGRGVYICYDMECLKKVNKRINKLFGVKMNDDMYDEIKKIIENKIGGDIIG